MALANPPQAARVRSLSHIEPHGFPSPLHPKPRPPSNPSINHLPSLNLSTAPFPSSYKPFPQLRRPLRSTRILPGTPPLNDDDDDGSSLPQSSSEDRLHRRARLIAAATVASKILGLVREIVLAAVIGVGPVATAFNHAASIPRFSTSFLGGVNGPIHIVTATTLSKQPKGSRRQLTEKTQIVMFLLGSALACMTCLFAELILFISAPGLVALAEGHLIREMAITQLKIMSPCILFAGSLGIGFGCLTAEGNDIIASLSPSMSSMTIIISCMIYFLMKRADSFGSSTALSGVCISCGASVGALLQWIIQIMINKQSGYVFNSISWKDYLEDKDVHKLFALLVPAIFSSGLAHVAFVTDLYFSSFIPGAAAGLSYAHLLAMAPLGILSSTIILPRVPNFSQLAKPSSFTSLKENLQKATLLCMVVVLPITCTMCALAEPVIRILFQRFMFHSDTTSFVSSLLLCYSIGSPFWIIRELFGTICFSLGDGNWPLVINLTAVVLNGILDWLSVAYFGLGAHGLALSTSCVTALLVLALSLLLSKRLRGIISVGELVASLLLLLASCICSVFTTVQSYRIISSLLSSISNLRFCRLDEAASILLAGFLGMLAFYIPLMIAKFPGVMLLNSLLKTQINRQHL